MVKRWLPSVALLILLSVLVVAYVVITSDSPSEMVYTADERRALTIHRQMHLRQDAPYMNVYAGDVLLTTSGIDTTALPPIGATLGAADCRAQVTLDARYEEIEGVTTTVYDLDFEGTYRLRYAGSVPTTTLELIFPFPEGLDTLNQVYFQVNDDGELKEPDGVQYSLHNITWWTTLESGEDLEVVVRYRARGVGSFHYALDHNRRYENLDVEITVRGLTGSEVPSRALPTTAVERTEDGEKFAWRYGALIADRDVQITLPKRPGFVQRVEQLQEPLRALSLASPLLVALFVACLAGVHRLSGVRLPVPHYLLAGLGFFLFYPALTFLSGVAELPLAAPVALVVITALLLVFLGRAAGFRCTWWQTLLLCAVFLGLFSLGGMSPWRGLLLTAGGTLLVGLFMLLAARHRPPQLVEAAPEVQECPEGEPDVAEPEAKAPEAPSRYCPLCGAPLDETFAFCPACGHDADVFRRCPACGAEHYVPPDADLSHCPACGEPLTK